MMTLRWRLLNLFLLLFVLLSLPIPTSSYAILVNYTTSPFNTETPFWNNTKDEDMISKCDRAEADLRLYIYPIPAQAAKADVERQVLAHFMMETQFFRYIQKSQKNVVVTTDPAQANAFFIDHHTLHMSAQMGEKSCEYIDTHLRSIVDNVIISHPYFNKSQGKDHFLFSVFDHGPFCEHVCQLDKTFSESITATMERVRNINFIGNFGMDDAAGDKGYHQSWSSKGKLCHRIGQDIVIPQMINHQLIQYRSSYPYTGLLDRPFDSSFAGSYWGERVPTLATMAKYRLVDYTVNKTEKFWFDITGGSADLTMTHKSLYMYHVCGYACWSNRLYHAMGVSTIPILVTTGVVQAFERFIDWRKISVKMSLKTWFNNTARTEWRARNLRPQVEEYRNTLFDFYKSWGEARLKDEWFKTFGTGGNAVPDNEHLLSMYDNEYRLQKNETDASFMKLASTKIWYKKVMMERAIHWFDFSLNIDGTSTDKSRNAYRLLFLEIWCQVGDRVKVLAEPMCQNSASHIARIEYD